MVNQRLHLLNLSHNSVKQRFLSSSHWQLTQLPSRQAELLVCAELHLASGALNEFLCKTEVISCKCINCRTSDKQIHRQSYENSSSILISFVTGQVEQHFPSRGGRGLAQGVGGHSLARHNANPLWHTQWVHSSNHNDSPSNMMSPEGLGQTMGFAALLAAGSSTGRTAL